MAFERHNIEKRRLIELVRMNPILWDCRLPHYKRSDKKKAIKWEEVGRIFSVNGERVQRTFTSLREIFRRELNHEKLLGSRFKSKWEFYNDMAFLKEVIRERKSRERTKHADLSQHHHQQHHQQQNQNSIGIDEYQYFAPNDPNNPSNHQQPLQLLQQQTTPNSATIAASLQLQLQLQKQQQQPQPAPQQPPQQPPPPPSQQSEQLLQTQPDLNLSINTNFIETLQKDNTISNNNNTNNNNNNNNNTNTNTNNPNTIANTDHQQSSQQQHSPNILTISHSSSSSPSIYIKDEPDSQDDTISLLTEHNENASASCFHSPQEPKSQLPLKPLLKNGRINNAKKSKRIRNAAKLKSLRAAAAANLAINDDDDDDLAATAAGIEDDPDVDMLDDRLSIASSATLAKQQQSTAREILYAKFGDFLAARLNTLHETIANDLMNRILLLIADK